MSGLVKYLLSPCSSTRPEDMDMGGAVIQLSAPLMKWIISVMDSFGPLSDQLKQKTEKGEIPELEKLVFDSEIVEWLERHSLNATLGGDIDSRLDFFDLTTPVQDTGFKDYIVVQQGMGRAVAMEPELAIDGVQRPEINTLLQLIWPWKNGHTYELTRMNICEDNVYWTAWIPYGDAAQVQVETFCIYKETLEELLEELKAGKGLPPMPVQNKREPCGEPYFANGLMRARCTQPRYSEHDHSQYTASEAIAAGLAEPTTPTGRDLPRGA